jgi:HPt (histidine-containing phosphotransfer) domain-containing protein
MLIENADAPSGRLDSRYIDGLRALEPALVREIVVEFLGSTPTNLAELRVASYAADAWSVRQIAHKLRGASGMLGAVGMSAALERLENMGRAGSLGESPRALERLEQEFAAVRPVLEAELAA